MIRIIKRFLFLLLFCCCCKNLFAQNKYIDSLLAVLRVAKEDTSKVNLLNTLSSELVLEINYSLARKYADDALLLSEKLNFKKGIAGAYNNFGVIYSNQFNYGEAFRNYLTSLKIREEIGDKKGMAATYVGIGNIYDDQGNYPEALKNYLTSLKLREDIGYKNGIAASHVNIGNIYTYQRNYPEALKNYLAALKIFEERGANNGIAMSHNNIGDIYRLQGNYAEALKNYLVSFKIYEKSGHKPGIADAHNYIGLLYSDEGNYIEASKNYLISLKINEEVGDKQRIADNYNNLGRLNIKLHKPAEAKKYLDDALSLNKQMGIRDEIRDAYNDLAELDSLQGNFKSAFDNYKMYVLYRDSLINSENTVKIVGMQMQYEFDKKEAVTKLEQEKAIEATKNRSNLILMSSVILIISSLFIILLIRQVNLKKRAIEKANTAHKMAELELQSLRTQLNPHFMFNSLNSIQELILLEENEKSQAYLARFGKLLRMLLENAESPFISLRKEIDFLRLYLGLENLRVPDLQYSISTDPTLNTEETLIPNMILQPYIENAIWHGLSHKETDKQLQIRIYRENGTVNYEIEDNGVGRTKAAELKSLFRKKHKSKGMELLTKRFKLLNEEYGSDIKTTVTDVIKNNEVAGTLVRVTVPVKLTEHLQN